LFEQPVAATADVVIETDAIEDLEEHEAGEDTQGKSWDS
jgi:hypothetical protein